MTIETERLLLRPFQDSDAGDVYEYLIKGSPLTMRRAAANRTVF